MFRLYLVDQLQTAQLASHNHLAGAGENRHKRPKRNRRIYDRFDIDHKHLSLMNDQDILLIRDISEFGFSTEVSSRGFKRLNIGDTYRCRLRYLNEIYEVEACVRWKLKNFVGFEIVKNSPKLNRFMKRLIKPIEIASTFNKVDDMINKLQHDDGMEWYQGVDSSNFYLWRDEFGHVKSWCFESSNRYLKWKQGFGLSSGSWKSEGHFSELMSNPKNREASEDMALDGDLTQLVLDVFMAFPIPEKQELINSIQS